MRREFSAKVKVEAFKRANGCCEVCGVKLSPGNVEYDHGIPDGLGGNPDLDNCRALCRNCHGQKTKSDVRDIAKAKRRERRHMGIRKPSRFACSRDSRWKKRMDGTVVER